MTESEAKKYMLIEKECINRNCNRDCANCDIVQDVEDLNNAYDVAINALEKQIPKKRVTTCEFVTDCCPNCKKYISDWLEYNKFMCCPYCGQRIDWSVSE